MILLATNTQKLQVLLGGAVSTNQVDYTSHFVDLSSSSYTPGVKHGVTNDTTPVDVVLAPAAATYRQIKSLSLYNADSATVTITVRLNDSGTTRNLLSIGLASGFTLWYTDAEGWRVLDTSGQLRTYNAGVGGGGGGAWGGITGTLSDQTDLQAALDSKAWSTHSHGNPTLNLTNLSATTASASNGLSLSLSAAAQSTQPVAVSGSNGSFAYSTLSLGDLNGLSFYTSNGSVVGSYTVPTQSTQPVAASGSNGSFAFSTLSFGALNGLTFYTSNGSLVGSYTVPTQSNQSVGQYALGNTTGQSSSSTWDARSLSFAGAGIVSVGLSAGSGLVVSATQSNQAFSADASSTFQTLVFQNSNGVSFSNNAGSLRVTHDLQFTSATSNITSNALHSSASRVINVVAATNNTGGGTASVSGNVSFSNANGLTFYTSAGNAVVGSYTVPAQTVQPVAASGSNGSFAFSTLSHGNLNGLSFYTSNGSIVASYTVPTQSVQPVAVSGSNGSFAFSTLTLGNSNGASFYTTNGSVVVSYTVPTQSNQTLSAAVTGNTVGNTSGLSVDARSITLQGLGAASVGLSTSAGGSSILVSAPAQTTQPVAISGSNGSFAFSTVTFGNLNGLSFYTSNGSVVGSYTVPAGGAPAISGSNGSFTFNTLTLGALNGLTLYTSNSSLVGSYTVPSQSVQPVAVSGSNGSFAFSTVTFGNLNGVSFYTSNGSVVASYTVPTQSNQTISLAMVGNTTGNTSGMSVDARSWTLQGLGAASVGLSTSAGGSSVIVSVPTQSTQPVAVSGSNGSFAFSTVTFGNLNGLSFYTSNGSVVGSYTVPAGGSPAASGSNGSFTFNTLTFGALNGLTLYTSNSSIVGSYTVPTQTVQPVAISGSNGSFNFSTVTFGNLNGLSFYTSNGSLVGSYTVPAQSNQQMTLFATSNTTQSSSGTSNASSLIFAGAGGVSVGISNGSVVISGGAAGGGGVGVGVSNLGNTAGSTGTVTTGNVVLAALNGLSLSQSTAGAGSAATVSILGPVYNDMMPYKEALIATGQIGQNTVQIQPVTNAPYVSFDRLGYGVFFSQATSLTLTVSCTVRLGIYSKNGSTLSQITSHSGSFSINWQGTQSSSAYSGLRWATMTLNGAGSISGDVWIALHSSTTTAGNPATLSNIVASRLNSTWSGYLGVGSAATAQTLPGMGVFSVTTGALPSSMAFSEIQGNSSAFQRPQVFFLTNGAVPN